MVFAKVRGAAEAARRVSLCPRVLCVSYITTLPVLRGDVVWVKAAH